MVDVEEDLMNYTSCFLIAMAMLEYIHTGAISRYLFPLSRHSGSSLREGRRVSLQCRLIM